MVTNCDKKSDLIMHISSHFPNDTHYIHSKVQVAYFNAITSSRLA